MPAPRTCSPSPVRLDALQREQLSRSLRPATRHRKRASRTAARTSANSHPPSGPPPPSPDARGRSPARRASAPAPDADGTGRPPPLETAAPRPDTPAPGPAHAPPPAPPQTHPLRPPAPPPVARPRLRAPDWRRREGRAPRGTQAECRDPCLDFPSPLGSRGVLSVALLVGDSGIAGCFPSPRNNVWWLLASV